MAKPEYAHTWRYVEHWAAKTPEAEALIFGDDRISWAEFAERMDATARAFIEIGVERGDRVAMLAMACPEFLISFMAANKIGAMWLGLSPKFTLDELRYIVADSLPTALIALTDYMDADLSETVDALAAEFDCIEKVLVIGGSGEAAPDKLIVPGAEDFAEFTGRARPELDIKLDVREAAVGPDDDALLMYTSGSTGKPKGVVHTHLSIIENIRVQAEKFFFAPDMRMLMHFPINHVAADVEVGFGTVLAGGCLVLMDRFDPAGSLAAIEAEQVTHLGQIPAMFLLQFKDPSFAPAKFASVRYFVWAGAAAPRMMIAGLAKLCEATGAVMITGYGSTEVCGFVTYSEPGDDLEYLASAAGRIAAPFELKIVDERRADAAEGEIGEIAVRGSFLMKGYYNNDAATARVVDPDGWYYTGDLARLDDLGYIHIAGRRSEMFKTGGENVYPREVEDVIESHPGVLFAAVIAVPDETFQEVGWAFAMTAPGQPPPDDAALDALCRERLANFKAPKRFFVREALPLLANGKIDKVALAEEAKAIAEDAA